MSMHKVQHRSSGHVDKILSRDMNMRNGSHFLDPEEALVQSYAAASAPRIRLDPMSDLDLMIANGWGDTPQHRLPADWRTRKKA